MWYISLGTSIHGLTHLPCACHRVPYRCNLQDERLWRRCYWSLGARQRVDATWVSVTVSVSAYKQYFIWLIYMFIFQIFSIYVYSVYITYFECVCIYIYMHHASYYRYCILHIYIYIHDMSCPCKTSQLFEELQSAGVIATVSSHWSGFQAPLNWSVLIVGMPTKVTLQKRLFPKNISVAMKLMHPCAPKWFLQAVSCKVMTATVECWS